MVGVTHAMLWDKYMRSYDFLQKVDSYRENLSDIVKALSPCPGEHILDAGSGTGNLSLLLKSNGANVESCDFSESALSAHRLKDPNAILIKTSLEEPLPFASGTFDAIACASVLFTLTDTGCQLALSEFYRILKPGGRLVVTTAAPHQRTQNLIGMHFSGLTKRRGLIAGWIAALREFPALARVLYYNSRLTKLPDWRGFHRFTQEELQGLIAQAGFLRLSTSTTYGGRLFLAKAYKQEKMFAPVRLSP